MLKPIMPYVEYALNKDYIKTYLCINRDEPRKKCDGKCYLRNELKKAQDYTDTNQEPSQQVSTINLKDYPISTLTELGERDILDVSTVVLNFSMKIPVPSNGYGLLPYNPPRFA